MSEALDWIAEMFGNSGETLTPETKREEIPEWDSLGVLTLMAELDEKFQISASDRDIQAMASVDDVLQFLRSNGVLIS